MNDKERQAANMALEALHAELEAGTCEEFENAAEKCYEAITALREVLEVTEASISDHKSEKVMVSVDFLRQVEQLLIEFKMDEEYEWGNCRPLEVMEEKKLLPEEVYQIRKILEEAPVSGFTQAHTSE